MPYNCVQKMFINGGKSMIQTKGSKSTGLPSSECAVSCVVLTKAGENVLYRLTRMLHFHVFVSTYRYVPSKTPRQAGKELIKPVSREQKSERKAPQMPQGD